MHTSFRRRDFAVSAILLSFSFTTFPSAFADGLVQEVAAPVGGILKTGVHAATSLLHTGSSAANSILQNGPSALTPKAMGSASAALPIDPREGKSVGRDYPILEGEVNSYQPNTAVSRTVDNLVDAALAKDPRTEQLNGAVDHYRHIQSKLFASLKDGVNNVVPYRGFDPSIEAGDVATGENLKIRSLGSAEYARQKHIDELHVKVVASVMQMATGLGMTDKVQGQQKFAAEVNILRNLVGDDQAYKAAQAMTDWSNTVNVPESAFNQPTWDINQQKEKILAVTSNALNSDPVVGEVMMRLHKYNHRSKFARVSAHVIETALGTISLAPDFIGAGGKLALCAFVTATGGPEQAKMMKEAYFGKRLESRSNVLTDETNLAMQNYQIGSLTRNGVLMAASEAIIQQMAGPEIVPQVFGVTITEAARPGNIRSSLPVQTENHG